MNPWQISETNKANSNSYSKEILNNLNVSEKIRLAVKLYKSDQINIGEAIGISGVQAELFASILRGMNIEVRRLNVLVCGGAGFIGSNFINYMVKKYPHYKIVNLDKLTYAGNVDNLKEVE